MACEFLLLGFGAGFLNGLLGLPGPLHLVKGRTCWVEFLIWVMVVILHHLRAVLNLIFKFVHGSWCRV